MNALTISLDIKGTCRILGEQFTVSFNGEIIRLVKGQTQFSYNSIVACTKGWNELKFVHESHPDDLTVMEGNAIKNYSTISLDTIKINDYEVSNNMYQRSGSKAYNPITHKHLHNLYDLGEPFVVNYKFYYPIEYWTFALATSKANWGKMGWKHG
jgi:hypothetical protein